MTELRDILKEHSDLPRWSRISNAWVWDDGMDYEITEKKEADSLAKLMIYLL